MCDFEYNQRIVDFVDLLDFGDDPNGIKRNRFMQIWEERDRQLEDTMSNCEGGSVTADCFRDSPFEELESFFSAEYGSIDTSGRTNTGIVVTYKCQISCLDDGEFYFIMSVNAEGGGTAVDEAPVHRVQNATNGDIVNVMGHFTMNSSDVQSGGFGDSLSVNILNLGTSTIRVDSVSIIAEFITPGPNTPCWDTNS